MVSSRNVTGASLAETSSLPHPLFSAETSASVSSESRPTLGSRGSASLQLTMKLPRPDHCRGSPSVPVPLSNACFWAMTSYTESVLTAPRRMAPFRYRALAASRSASMSTSRRASSMTANLWSPSAHASFRSRVASRHAPGLGGRRKHAPSSARDAWGVGKVRVHKLSSSHARIVVSSSQKDRNTPDGSTAERPPLRTSARRGSSASAPATLSSSGAAVWSTKSQRWPYSTRRARARALQRWSLRS
mmetsp:Transcript_33726/g.100432  ORF Transcript_33726/g.100432 Transcript_33726/m.100432 type:complete len:246 (-) Transcript_33726:636-1373(-)